MPATSPVKLDTYMAILRYGNDDNFSIQMRMLKSLTFVPENDIRRYYPALYISGRKVAKWLAKNYGSGRKRMLPRLIARFYFITITACTCRDFDHSSFSFSRLIFTFEILFFEILTLTQLTVKNTIFEKKIEKLFRL